MRLRLRNTLLCVDYAQLLPSDNSIEEINPVLRWADARGQVQL